jgi:hypothetical protein
MMMEMKQQGEGEEGEGEGEGEEDFVNSSQRKKSIYSTDSGIREGVT